MKKQIFKHIILSFELKGFFTSGIVKKEITSFLKKPISAEFMNCVNMIVPARESVASLNYQGTLLPLQAVSSKPYAKLY